MTALTLLHIVTGVLCAAVAVARLPRWREPTTRATTIALVAFAGLMVTTLTKNSDWERNAPGVTWMDIVSYIFAITASVAMVYLAARALSYTKILWLTHTAAIVCGGFIGAYICASIHYEGHAQGRFLLVITACITGFAGLFLFAATLPAIAEREVPRSGRLTLLVLAASSLLWAIGAARRIADNIPVTGPLVTLAHHLPWEASTASALLFAVAGILSLYLHWQDEAPLKPDLLTPANS
ncbi:hypothetical protein AB0N05_38615 [Nocardia sp. NPDC051030]|uniref:hypothetical protein n=1 Tax=Nocardia sp. NPDC051030 TaxID=3155162 RepID=UPI00341CE8D0